jgi:large repetitive protein
MHFARRYRHFMLLPVLILAALALFPRPASAATYTVTNLGNSGAGSLRQAILDANASGTDDTITFSVSGTIVLTSGSLGINNNGSLTIEGAGITVSAGYASRVFVVNSGATVTMNGLTITGGSSGVGSGIYNSASLTLNNVTITMNSAGSGGAGIYSEGPLTIANSTISSNFGGGLYHAGPSLTVTGSTFSSNSLTGNGAALVGDSAAGLASISGSAFLGNTATGDGGAIYTESSVNVVNSTFSTNEAVSGGAVYNAGTTTLTNVTISGNTASGNGGGVYNNYATEMTIRNSILANNAGGDCHLNSGTINSSFSLIESSTACVNGINNNNFTATDPELGTLTGSPAYLPLLALSPVIDQGSDALIPGGVTTDQAGNARIQGVRVDMGAVEAPPAATADVSVTQSDDTTEVAEGGATDTLTLVLASAPTAKVFIVFTGTQVSTGAAQIEFSPLDWDTPQQVTVSAVDDSVAEGAHLGSVAFTVTSSDADYDGLSVFPVSVSITDDDVASVAVTQTDNITTAREDGVGLTDGISIRLTSQPASNVVVAFTAGPQLSLAFSSFTFTPDDWDTIKYVTTLAVNDDIAEGDHSDTVSFTVTSSDPNYNGLTLSPVTVQITDNDIASVAVTQTDNITTAREDGVGFTDGISIRLTSQPASNVVVAFTAGSQLSLAFSSFTFTPDDWDIIKYVTTLAVDDDVYEGDHSDTVSFTVTSSDPAYNGAVLAPVTVFITDDDPPTPRVRVTESSGSTAVTEGGATDTLTFVLDTQPTANVSITLTNSQVTTSKDLVVLTPADWDEPQTITVTAVDDAVVEGAHTGSISFSVASSDTSYNGIAIAPISVGITDNDVAVPGVTITQSGGTTAVTEGAATDSYTIVLDSAPSADVTVTITFPASDVTLNGDTDGTFTTTVTPANWNTPQPITLAAVDDRALEGNHTASLVHSFSGAAEYAGITATIDGTSTNTLVVGITDNESAVVRWSAASGSAAEGTVNTPTVEIDITASPADGTPTLEGTIPFTVTRAVTTAEVSDFTLPTGPFQFVNSTDLGTVPYAVDHLNDSLIEGDEGYTLTLALGTLPAGMTVTAPAVLYTATITDADSAALSVSAGASVSEAAGTHPVTVTLTTAAGNTLENEYTASLQLNSDTAVYSGATGDMFFAGPSSTTTVTFPAGAGNGAAQTADIQIVSDRVVEASTASSPGFNTPERFNVQLGTVSGAIGVVTITAPAAIPVTIDEDDFAYVTMGSATAITPENLSLNIQVKVRLVTVGTGDASTALVQDGFSVPIATDTVAVVNAATPGSDFTSVSTSLIFPAGATDEQFVSTPLTIIDDAIDEFYGALISSEQNRERLTIGFSATRGSYAGVPILVPNTANDDCAFTLGFMNECRAETAVIITDNDTADVIVSESGGNTAVVEGGAGDAYTVVLATQPTSNVTVNISFAPLQVIVNGDTDGTTSLIFTPADWDTPQSVTVFAVNDTLFEANPHTSVIQQTITSTDLVYNAINPADVTVSITDNDTIRVVFSVASSSVSETVNTTSPTARLDIVSNGSPGGTLPTAVTVPITLTLDNAEAGDLTQTTTQVIFSAGTTNGATRPIDLTIANDLLLEGDETATLSFGTPTGQATVSGTHVLTILDDEAGAITFNSSTSAAPEGTTPHSVGVSLAITGTGTGDPQLENSASVAITTVPVTASTPADYSLTTSTVTFVNGTNSPIAGTIQVDIVDDALVETPDETFDLVFGSITGDGQMTATGTHTVTITDNDVSTAGVTVTQSGGTTAVTEGGATDTFTVVLNAQPTSDVSIFFTNTQVTTDPPAGLTFTTGNWNVARTVTVTAVDDANVEGAHTGSVSFSVVSADTNYNGFSVPAVSVSITDNDTPPTPGVTILPLTLTTSEAGGTDTFSVVLGSQPTADVTIAFTVQNPAEGSLSALSVTFTGANWNTAQTVTVTGLDDALDDGDVQYLILTSASSTDPTYDGIETNTLTVINLDDDPVSGPGATPTPPAPAATLPPAPDVPTCSEHNFSEGGVVRASVSDALGNAIACRVLIQNGESPTYFGSPMYGIENIGVPGLEAFGILQAIDIFSPAGLTRFEGGGVFCLRGQGTLIWLAASRAPRRAEIIGSYSVPDFPGFTCATLFEPGTLVLLRDNPLG